MSGWTKKAEKKYGWNLTGLEYYVSDVYLYMSRKHGTLEADRAIAPLTWWIFTGRAPLPDCKLLVEKKPYIIGRLLVQMSGKNYADIIEAIRAKIQ